MPKNSAKTPVPFPKIKFNGWQPQPYRPILAQMQEFTDTRSATTPDRIWFMCHERVFTQGQNGKPEHLLAPGDIEVIPIDRGGQVTYHGPGQIMVYTLVDIKRLKLGVRAMVTALENTIVDTLQGYGIDSHALAKAPGVYVGDDKIASLGLRIRHGCSYHGFALNVNMDLEPFTRINPCGYEKLKMTQVVDHGGPSSLDVVKNDLLGHLIERFDLPQPQSITQHSA